MSSSSSVTMTAIKKQHVPTLGYQQVLLGPFGAYWMWQDYFNHPSFTSARIFRYHVWNFRPGFHSCNFPNFLGLYQLVQAGTGSERFFVGLLMTASGSLCVEIEMQSIFSHLRFQVPHCNLKLGSSYLSYPNHCQPARQTHQHCHQPYHQTLPASAHPRYLAQGPYHRQFER